MIVFLGNVRNLYIKGLVNRRLIISNRGMFLFKFLVISVCDMFEIYLKIVFDDEFGYVFEYFCFGYA